MWCTGRLGLAQHFALGEGNLHLEVARVTLPQEAEPSGWGPTVRINEVSVTGSSSRVGPCRTPIMFSAGAHQRLFYAGLDIAFRLPTNSGQLRDYKVMRAFEHALFAE